MRLIADAEEDMVTIARLTYKLLIMRGHIPLENHLDLQQMGEWHGNYLQMPTAPVQ